MIESISIANIATYKNIPETVNGLRKINFFFGSNGSGKTTISRIINEAANYSDCKIKWKNDSELQTMVYNRDFIKNNFSQHSGIKGIFTLGEKNIDNEKKIELEKIKLNDINNKIGSLKETLKTKESELAKKNEEFKEKCWQIKSTYEKKFEQAFKGYLNSKEKFKEKILSESNINSSHLLSLEELEEKSITLFGTSPTIENAIPSLEYANLLAYESDIILEKRIIGKEDIDIAAMIKKLCNSDWVNNGRKYYHENNQICPFCQQKTSSDFHKKLEEYFDETYNNDINSITALLTNYQSSSNIILQEIRSIIDNAPSKHLNVEKLETENTILKEKINSNILLIQEKKKEASQTIKLIPLTNILENISLIIIETNKQINENNIIANDFTNLKKLLISQVWQYIVGNAIQHDLNTYKADRAQLEKAINAIKLTLENKSKDIIHINDIIRKLERESTSILPTIDNINKILNSYDFSFRLQCDKSSKFYKIVRHDGSEAKETLSEGEITFITFLYFYNLISGSTSEDGINNDRVVVFDDPVSSLDSNILFIVGSLIKKIINDIRSEKHNIKQMFILTHNVYFHKEVTFTKNRSQNNPLQDETFWIIRKSGMQSKVEKKDTNPVKTSYQYLWNDVKNPDRSNISIQNTLRRILENYFKILGGMDFDAICNHFTGQDKIICNSLTSWINDGSHFVDDDLYTSIEPNAVDTFLRVFREIFEKTGHIQHYNMMNENT